MNRGGWICAILLAAPVIGQRVAHAQADTAGQGELERFFSAERVTAWARLDYFEASNSVDGQREFIGATLQIKALPRLTDFIDSKVEGRVTAPDARDRPGYGPQAQLLEGYLVFHFAHQDLRVGKQIVAWGRADGINPTDNLTPRDARVLLPLDEDQRLGTWSARLDTFLSQSLTLTIFTSPFFAPDRFPLPTAGLPIETLEPGHSLRAEEAGVKLDHVAEGFDWSVSYYHGYSLLPAVGATGAQFELSYDRMEVLGADCARNFGRFGFRSELAYTLPSDHGDIDSNAFRSRLFWVSGIDRTFFENLNLNLQVLLRWMPGYRNPADVAVPVAREAAIFNALILGQEQRAAPGVTFRVSDQWLNDTLRIELFGVMNATHGDYYLRPLVTYDVSDRLRASLGANFYNGPHLTQYGTLKPDAGVFAEVRYAL